MSSGLRVAVVIPTYNRAPLVVEAVESALGQTAPCEVVVVDDGSTDDTLQRLEAFGDAIVVLSQENRERGAARNAGAEVVPDADLLCFLDADDLLLPDHVARLGDLARHHPHASVVVSGARTVDLDGRVLEGSGTLGPSRASGVVTLEPFLLGRERIPTSAAAFPRQAFDAVGGFDERRGLAGSEDWLLKARVLALGPGVPSPEVGALIRKHEGNSMQDAAAMEQSMLRAHEVLFDEVWPEVEDEDGARGLSPRIRERSRARLLLDAATQHYAVGAMGRARRLLRRAAVLDPTVVLQGTWGWTLLRSLLGPRLSAALRRWKRGRGRGE